jgi:small subunit ribosomal protein S6
VAEALQENTTRQTEYETIYILRPDTAADSSLSVVDRVKDVINKAGKLTKIENWGRRRLAYDVARNKRGLYVYLKYVGVGTVVSDVERVLRLQENVLKFHTVKLGASELVNDVKPEDIAYEHVEDLEDAEEQSYAETLGLESSRRSLRPDDDARGAPDAKDDDQADETDGAVAKETDAASAEEDSE